MLFFDASLCFFGLIIGRPLYRTVTPVLAQGDPTLDEMTARSQF